MSFLLSRDTKVIVRDMAGTQGASEFRIIAGHTVEQQVSYGSSRSETSSLKYEGSRLPGKTYLDEKAPAKFNFVTYIDWEANTIVESPHDLLWKSLIGSSSAVSATSTDYNIDFSESSVTSQLPLRIWILLGNGTMITLTNAIIDIAEIDIDINKIATIKWYGTALNMSLGSQEGLPSRTYYEPENCLINKYTTIDLSVLDIDYTFPIVNGNIKITNNNEYYTRRMLGHTTVTRGHIPGVLEVSGNLKAYLRAFNFTNRDSGFISTLMTVYGNSIDNIETDLTINIGNSNTSTPRVSLSFPKTSDGLSTVMLKLPKLGFDDIVTTDIEFINIADGGYPFLQYVI